ncbi:MAG: MFS transporter [Verrucomicrobiaceae bacterium]|jgi:MFS family permease|nr:MFS transporter [Verrucomicrobiaceae bacterium]
MNIKEDGLAPNAGRLLWAGFMAILAAGIGFGVRGGIMANWGSQFGFTGGQLGQIAGAGLQGFCFGIFIGGIIVDKVGYGKLVLAAFLFHIVSAFVTFGASGDVTASAAAFQYLYWGTFIFAVANGTLEAVANPLVATLFPKNRTHYLNILHASWPAGLVIGGIIGWTMGNVSWKIQLGLFIVPTIIYGIMFLGQKMPKSEASEKGLSMGSMFKDIGLLGGAVGCLLIVLFIKDALAPNLTLLTGSDFFVSNSFLWVALIIGGGLWATIGVITKGSFGHWLIFVLFITHALVGAVELGTDSWIQNITGNILTPEQGKILFVFTSMLMFALRFCADFIEKKMKLSPIGILLVCSVLAFLGLHMVSNITTFMGAMVALGVYALGKTFFWPTMLAVVGDRFPQSGAVAMSIMGGIGMMSAGVLGGPGLGYAKDRFAGEALESQNAALYTEYRAEAGSKFLTLNEVNGIDGAKLGDIQAKLAAGTELTADESTVNQASITGDRETLKADAYIPAIMAIIYILLLIYFKAIGGYKAVKIDGTEEEEYNVS